MEDYSKFFPIKEYYKRVVVPINRNRFSINTKGKMICFNHGDTDPSLGIIPSKGVEVCHCFGCGYSGDILKVHTTVSAKYFKKYFNDKESLLKDLCKIFNISYDSLPKPEEDAIVDECIKEELALAKAINKDFDILDFKNAFIQGKLNKKGVGYYNALIMMMIDSLKEE